MNRTTTVCEIAGQWIYSNGIKTGKLFLILLWNYGNVSSSSLTFWFVKLYQIHSAWMMLNQLVHRNCWWLFMEAKMIAVFASICSQVGTSLKRGRCLFWMTQFAESFSHPVWITFDEEKSIESMIQIKHTPRMDAKMGKLFIATGIINLAKLIELKSISASMLMISIQFMYWSKFRAIWIDERF